MDAFFVTILLIIAVFFTHISFSKSHEKSIILQPLAAISWIFLGMALTNVTYRWGGDWNVVTYTASETLLQYPLWAFAGFIGVLILINFIIQLAGGEFTKPVYTDEPLRIKDMTLAP